MKYKKILCLVVFLSTLVFEAVGQDHKYEIVRIYGAKKVMIGGKDRKEGDTFKDTDCFSLVSSRPTVYVKRKNDGKIKVISAKVMENKKAKTLREYFFGNRPGGTRGGAALTFELTSGKSDAEKYPEKRIALVIGNTNYDSNPGILPNAHNDARDVSQRLLELGFDVVTRYDANLDQMKSDIDKFFYDARRYKVVLFYFAGHGGSYDGEDYITSIDYDGGLESIKNEFSIAQLMKEKSSPDYEMIFIIDACRTPKTAQQRTPPIRPERSDVLIQSTSSNNLAYDNFSDGDYNSPFAAEFIDKIGSVNTNVARIFLDIREAVGGKTNGSQNPIMVGYSDFKFICGTTQSGLEDENKKKDSSQAITYTAEELTAMCERSLTTYYGLINSAEERIDAFVGCFYDPSIGIVQADLNLFKGLPIDKDLGLKQYLELVHGLRVECKEVEVKYKIDRKSYTNLGVKYEPETGIYQYTSRMLVTKYVVCGDKGKRFDETVTFVNGRIVRIDTKEYISPYRTFVQKAFEPMGPYEESREVSAWVTPDKTLGVSYSCASAPIVEGGGLDMNLWNRNKWGEREAWSLYYQLGYIRKYFGFGVLAGIGCYDRVFEDDVYGRRFRTKPDAHYNGILAPYVEARIPFNARYDISSIRLAVGYNFYLGYGSNLNGLRFGLGFSY